MQEIKEELREAIKLREELDVLQKFEYGNPEDYVTRGELVKVLTILIKIIPKLKA